MHRHTGRLIKTCNICKYTECEQCRLTVSKFDSVYKVCLDCDKQTKLMSDVLTLHYLEQLYVKRLSGKSNYLYTKFYRDPLSLTETEINHLLLSDLLYIKDILQ